MHDFIVKFVHSIHIILEMGNWTEWKFIYRSMRWHPCFGCGNLQKCPLIAGSKAVMEMIFTASPHLVSEKTLTFQSVKSFGIQRKDHPREVWESLGKQEQSLRNPNSSDVWEWNHPPWALLIQGKSRVDMMFCWILYA